MHVTNSDPHRRVNPAFCQLGLNGGLSGRTLRVRKLNLEAALGRDCLRCKVERGTAHSFHRSADAE